MKIWFTIAGTNHYCGSDFMKKGMKVRLEKEPDNKYDNEAIKVLMDSFGNVGYVANSRHTVIGDSWSAGRLYDKIGKKAKGKIKYVTDKGVLCCLKLDDPENPDSGKKQKNREAEADGQLE